MIYDMTLLGIFWLFIVFILLRIFQGAARRDRAMKKIYVFDGWRIEAIELYIDQIEDWKESGIARAHDLDLLQAAKLALYKRQETTNNF
jgi:hypothetical protein